MEGKNKKCIVCGNLLKFGKKYCSHSCSMKHKNPMWNKQSLEKNKGVFRKGHIPSEEMITKMSKTWFPKGCQINLGRIRPDMIGHKWNVGKFDEKSSNWKGDDVGYGGVHQWIYRKYGKATKCELNKEHKSSRYEWANLNGRYSRDVKDYIQLCPSCHRRFDLGLFKIINKIAVYP